MRTLLLAALALTASAHLTTAPATSIDIGPDALLAMQIRDDLARLDRELAAEGTVAVGIGGTVDLDGGLVVRPIEVKEDSRCPLNVDCVWAGRFILRVEVSGAERDIALGESVATRHGVLTLAVVRPSRASHWPTVEMGGPPPPYRFGFRRG